MIRVEYKLGLRELAGAECAELEVGGCITLPQLIELAGLPENTVGMLFINDKWAPLDSVIRDGDAVRLYPDLEGG